MAINLMKLKAEIRCDASEVALQIECCPKEKRAEMIEYLRKDKSMSNVFQVELN